MKAYGSLVYSICYKSCGNPFDAEDLTQDVFLSAYRSIETFDGKYEKAWICKIAARKCLDYYKQGTRRILPAEDSKLEQVDTNASTWDAYWETDTRKQLLDACNRLKPPYNKIATLHFYEELSAREIAEQLGSNKKTIQTQIYRAKSMLRKLLEPVFLTNR